MEVGIRKRAWHTCIRYTLLIYDHWGEYTLSKKTRRLVYGVYPPQYTWIKPIWILGNVKTWANCRKIIRKCIPKDLFTSYKSVTSYQENNQNILVCWLYSCIYRSQTWILVFDIKINIYNVKRWFISRTTATVHCWRKTGSVGNCTGVLKRSVATGKKLMFWQPITQQHTGIMMNLEICSSEIIRLK